MHDSSVLVFIHIFAGTLGILSGFLAMFLRKGSRRHRQAGNVFFVSMLTMSSVAAYMALVGTEVAEPNGMNALQGILTFYLVSTAWLTARRADGKRGAVELLAFLVVAALVLGYATFGLEAARSATGLKYGYPVGIYVFFGSVALIAALLDVHLFIRGVVGAQRIARHLWRMSFGLWIAATSLFLGQPQVFPVWLHKTNLLFVPPVLIAVLMLYWLARTLFFGANRRKMKAPATAVHTPGLPQ
jgi:hypothetical protein